jgi:hypothetical protein
MPRRAFRAGCQEPLALSNWQIISKAKPGIGPVLLRCGSGPFDPVFVGRQDPESGRWFDGENRAVRPLFFALTPPFDLDEGAAA